MEPDGERGAQPGRVDVLACPRKYGHSRTHRRLRGVASKSAAERSNTVARMPGAVWKPLASNWATHPALTRHEIVCIHTMVGSLSGTDSYFRSGNGAGFAGTESHFGTGPNGEVTQWQDTSRQADANLNGNGRIISIENADFGLGFPKWNTNDGGAVPAFTAAQCEAIAQILAWCNKEHGIPLVLVPDSKSTRRGVAYHAQGVAGYS